MKIMFRYIRENGNILLLCTAVFLFSLAMNPSSLPKIIASIVILIILVYFRKFIFPIQSIRKLVPVFIYLGVFLSSFIYSQDIVAGMKSFEIKLLMFILPPLFILLDKSLFKCEQRIVEKIFILSLVFNVLISAIIFFQQGDFSRTMLGLREGTRFYHLTQHYHLSHFHHEAYFSLYLIWGLILSVDLFFSEKGRQIKIWTSAAAFIFICFLVLLNSRSAILAGFILAIYYFIKVLYLGRPWIRIGSALIMVMIGIGFLTATRVGRNIQTLILERNIQNREELDSRVFLWKNSINAIAKKPLFGYGIGDAQDALDQEYARDGYAAGFENRFNTHNQFLNIGVQAGVLGLIALLLLIGYPLYISIRKKHELLFLFLLISVICFMFESMLERLAGVAFFAFWYSYLFLVYYAENRRNENL